MTACACSHIPSPNGEKAGDSLTATQLFRNADPAFLARLRAKARTQTHEKGHLLFTQDDLAEWFYIVDSGWVKLYRQIMNGEEVILDILTQGALFGESSLFENKVYTYSAEIVQDATITAYPVALLADELERNQTFQKHMLTYLASCRTEREKEIEHRTVQNAAQRVGCFLLKTIEDKTRRDSAVAQLPYDKALVAARLGMKPETFSRALSRLKEDLDIVTKGSALEIPSMDRLIRYSCAACSNVFPCD